MPRLASTAIVLALLAATAAAFAITEGLKLQTSPITKVAVTKLFSPAVHRAVIRFRLRKKDTVTLSVEDANGKEVRTLLDSVPRRTGAVRVLWDGRNDSGLLVADGEYHPRVHLQHQHRTIVLPSMIRLDSTPPVVKSLHVKPRVVEPGARTTVRYKLSERAHVAVFVNRKRVALGHASRVAAKLDWRGRIDRRDLAPGRYKLTLIATDLAGNRSRPTQGLSILVPLRIVTPAVRTTVRASFVVHLLTDGRPFRWKLGRLHGVSRRHLLGLVAPDAPGRYALVLRQHGVRRSIVVTVK